MIFPDRTFRIYNELFGAVFPRNSYIVEFRYHLWIPFPDKLQSDVAIFVII